MPKEYEIDLLDESLIVSNLSSVKTVRPTNGENLYYDTNLKKLMMLVENAWYPITPEYNNSATYWFRSSFGDTPTPRGVASAKSHATVLNLADSNVANYTYEQIRARAISAGSNVSPPIYEFIFKERIDVLFGVDLSGSYLDNREAIHNTIAAGFNFRVVTRNTGYAANQVRCPLVGYDPNTTYTYAEFLDAIEGSRGYDPFDARCESLPIPVWVVNSDDSIAGIINPRASILGILGNHTLYAIIFYSSLASLSPLFQGPISAYQSFAGFNPFEEDHIYFPDPESINNPDIRVQVWNRFNITPTTYAYLSVNLGGYDANYYFI